MSKTLIRYLFGTFLARPPGISVGRSGPSWIFILFLSINFVCVHLVLSFRMLDEFADEIDQTQSKLDSTLLRMEKVLRLAGGKGSR